MLFPLFAMLLNSHLFNNILHETQVHYVNIFVSKSQSDGLDDTIIQ